MAPRMRRRGWVAPPVRTVAPAIRLSTSWAKPRPSVSGRPSLSVRRALSSCAAASPPGPAQSAPVWPSWPVVMDSAASARARLRDEAGRTASGSGRPSRARRRRRSRSLAPASPAFSSLSSSASQSFGRGPRRPCCSRATRAPARSSGRPRRASGCLRMASSRTGSHGSSADRASRPRSTPAGQWAKGAPAEESASMPQRARRADTRRARSRSGVTRAAVLPGVSSASRSRRAAAAAASSSVGAAMTARPSSPRAIGSMSSPPASRRSLSIWLRQSAVASAGRRASLINRRRQRPWVPPRTSATGHSQTSLRSKP